MLRHISKWLDFSLIFTVEIWFSSFLEVNLTIVDPPQIFESWSYLH